ncbi:Rho GTPase-activating protein 29 [Halotydeus destructor]|nr:Rho GTPase-activating protein 29 [Halotydeus destructor]
MSLQQICSKSRDWVTKKSVSLDFHLESSLCTKAFYTHKFTRKIHVTKAFCQLCDQRIVFSYLECAICNIFGHKDCVMQSYIRCGAKYNISNPFDTPTFGTYLTELRDHLPDVVRICVTQLESRDPKTIQFVYNATGDDEEMRKLTKAFNLAPKMVDLSQVAYYNVAYLVKKFFAELKNAVITSSPRRSMLEIIQLLSEKDMKNLDMCDRDLIKRIVRNKMADSHRVTLNYFVAHLKHIADKYDEVQMTVRDLADIFGPILCGRGEHTHRKDPKAADDRKLLRTLIYNWKNLFDSHEIDDK